MRFRAIWCGATLVLATLSGCGSTIAGTPEAAGGGGAGGSSTSGGIGGSGGASDAPVQPAGGDLSAALLEDGDFPSGGTVRRLTSLPANPSTAGATSNPPECAQKVQESQLTNTNGELAAAVYTGSDQTVLMEALQRPSSNAISVFEDILATCARFQMTLQGQSFQSSFERLPDGVLDSQPSIAVHQTISGNGVSLDTYSAVEESDGVTLYLAAIQVSGTADVSELEALAGKALDRKRSMLG